jgi:hypothetical protein
MIHGIHQGLLILGGFTILSTIIFQQLRRVTPVVSATEGRSLRVSAADDLPMNGKKLSADVTKRLARSL